MTDAVTMPDAARLLAAVDATWPAAESVERGGWRLRRGAGGGKRVSAASPAGTAGTAGTGGTGDIGEAEAAMRAWGQTPLFRLGDADAGLDRELAGRGYRVVDPVVLYAAPVARLAGEGSHVAACYRVEGLPAVLEEIWDAGGIGPRRRAVMDRVVLPRTRLLSRAGDVPCGAAFVAVDGEVAMIHAVEVLEGLRRRGAARLLMEGAARFAAEHGAAWLALAVAEANAPARALYSRLGMAEAGGYHYRLAPETSETP
jgi:GNAT superfamily N-acetyltransferase